MKTLVFEDQSFLVCERMDWTAEDWIALAQIFEHATTGRSINNCTRRLIAIMAPSLQARTANWTDEQLLKLFFTLGAHLGQEGSAQLKELTADLMGLLAAMHRFRLSIENTNTIGDHHVQSSHR